LATELPSPPESLWDGLVAWLRRRNPEDPRRLRAFRDQVKVLEWSDGTFAQSAESLFNAVDDLATAEVSYYFKRRRTRAMLSGGLNLLTWLFGTAGILVPLIAAANDEWKELNQYGYVGLALAGSFFGANALFGGTSGHMRFVTAQLDLERLITTSRVAFKGYLARCGTTQLTAELREAGVKLVEGYATDLYRTVLAETSSWRETLQAEMQQIRTRVNQGQSDNG
jgi:hypothetical protein